MGDDSAFSMRGTADSYCKGVDSGKEKMMATCYNWPHSFYSTQSVIPIGLWAFLIHLQKHVVTFIYFPSINT